MSDGPRGEWRPSDPIACAVHVGRIATGKIEETFAPPERSEEERGRARARASKAGKASRASQTPEHRSAGGKTPRPPRLHNGGATP